MKFSKIGKFVEKYKGGLLMMAALAVMFCMPEAANAAAGDQFEGFNNAGESAKSSTQGMIAAWIWVLALIPVGIGAVAAFKMREHLDQKEEQNQHEPKPMRYAKVAGAFLVGIAISFIVYGVFGTIFLGKTFSETWGVIVLPFWNALFA